jgi:hypothetical protein
MPSVRPIADPLSEEPMMPRITTLCPACGIVELDGEDVTLVISRLRGTAWYLFDCLGCAEQVVKSASSAVVTALTQLQIRVVTVPAEALETARSSSTPLTVDDLLDLLLELRTAPDVALLEVDVRPVTPRSRTATA